VKPQKGRRATGDLFRSYWPSPLPRIDEWEPFLGLSAERQMTQSQIGDEYVKQVIDKLLVAIFAKFPEYLPPLGWFRKYYASEDMLERVEEYFDGEDLVALRKFVKRFLHREPAPPRQVGEFTALELAGIDRLERYESRAWTRQMRATRSLIEIQRSLET
jgi:hypothetical protein